MSSMVKKFIVFSMLLPPKKFSKVCKGASEWNPDSKNTQVLYEGDSFRIEYNPYIQEMTKPPKKEKSYVDVIIAQCGLPPKDEDGKPKPMLYAIVQHNKKSLREFGRWLNRLWEKNNIPLTTKDGGYRVTFHNGVGVNQEILESINMSNIEGTNKFAFTGNEERNEQPTEEISNDAAEVKAAKQGDKPSKKADAKKASKDKDAKKVDKSSKDAKKAPKDKDAKKAPKDKDAKKVDKSDKADAKKTTKKDSPTKPTKDNPKGKKDTKKADAKADKSPKKADAKAPKAKEGAKMSTADKLNAVTKNLSSFLKKELKDTPVMLVKDADVAKAIGADKLPPAFMKNLQTALNEKFATSYGKDGDSFVITVWRPSKKRVPVGAMKV